MLRPLLTDAERAERKRYNGLRAILRRAWMWYSPARREAMAAAVDGRKVRCAKCQQLFLKKDVRVDHIVPCGRLSSEADIMPFIARLFVDAKGLQILCNPDHDAKTAQERAEAKEATHEC